MTDQLDTTHLDPAAALAELAAYHKQVSRDGRRPTAEEVREVRRLLTEYEVRALAATHPHPDIAYMVLMAVHERTSAEKRPRTPEERDLVQQLLKECQPLPLRREGM